MKKILIIIFLMGILLGCSNSEVKQRTIPYGVREWIINKNSYEEYKHYFTQEQQLVLEKLYEVKGVTVLYQPSSDSLFARLPKLKIKRLLGEAEGISKEQRKILKKANTWFKRTLSISKSGSMTYSLNTRLKEDVINKYFTLNNKDYDDISYTFHQLMNLINFENLFALNIMEEFDIKSFMYSFSSNDEEILSFGGRFEVMHKNAKGKISNKKYKANLIIF